MGINSFPPAGGSSGYEFPSELIDPVSKFRVSQPENLIDTDFEYGLQPTKWETVELINNTPSFFSKSGDTTIDGISSIITNAGTREIIVKTELDHGLAVGIPINVTGTKSITADGSYIINSIPDTKTFTYLCKDDQDDTASILDLYSSIITGEFFQGSQLRVSDSEGIVTDAEGTSELTVTTNSTHGFGSGTPFYFLNLNSTVAQEFQAANTASKTFDASNSATAQTFDGSNTLSSFSIDWSNSAVEGGTVSNITSTDTANSRITVSHTTENFASLPLGTPLYYSVSAVSGYFNTNPRGVVFLKTTTSLGTSNSTFQVSLVPDGEPILFTTTMSGTFQLANQARTFAGNNQDPVTQRDVLIQVGPEFSFDGANESPQTLTVTSYSGQTINLSGPEIVDYYNEAMVLYNTTGTPATGLTDNTTYFVTSYASSAPGAYSFSVTALPGSSQSPISISGGTGTQTFKKIGVSIDKDIFHVRNAGFVSGDMIEYTYPTSTPNQNFDANSVKKFYFIDVAYDNSNFKLSDDVGFKPILATGGNVITEIYDEGRTWRVHQFTTTGTSNLVVSSIGETDQIEYLIVAGGGGAGGTSGDGWNSGGGGAGGILSGSFSVVAGTSYPIVVGAGGAAGTSSSTNNGSITTTGLDGQNSSAFGQTATGGGGGGASSGFSGGQGSKTIGRNGGSGGGAGTNFNTNISAGGTRVLGQGNVGGAGSNTGNGYGGGGGGKGTAGINNISGWFGAVSAIESTGGAGRGFSSTFNNSTYGKGGGTGTGGTGNVPNSPANSGNGGNSPGSPNNVLRVGGAGGSGTVFVRYPITAPPVPGEYIIARGGQVSTTISGGIRFAVHQFKNVGTETFTILNSASISANNNVQYLIVAGGGGGGHGNGITPAFAGGGAGGLLQGTTTLTQGSYNIVVGDGGLGGSNSGLLEGGVWAYAANGQNSSAFGLTAIGGGGAGGGAGTSGRSGGSGGGQGGTGGGGTAPNNAPGTPGQGFAGGARENANNDAAGGGGGAGGPGGNGSGGLAGTGGPGIFSSITGTSLGYAGGAGRLDGGFRAGHPANGNAADNSGSGGGGASGVGGSGIVIIRYPIGVV